MIMIFKKMRQKLFWARKTGFNMKEKGKCVDELD